MQELESSGNDSVSEWIEDLKDGKERAAAKLWNRFFRQIRSLARSKLGAVPGAARDEEDVALSTLHDVFSGAQEGRFERLENRNDFWQLVNVILSRKAMNLRRDLLARRETLVSDLSHLDHEEDPFRILEKAAQDRSHEYDLDSLGIECEELLGMLDERQHRIALLKLAGLTNEEIAASQGCHVSTIERSLQAIRSTWKNSMP